MINANGRFLCCISRLEVKLQYIHWIFDMIYNVEETIFRNVCQITKLLYLSSKFETSFSETLWFDDVANNETISTLSSLSKLIFEIYNQTISIPHKLIAQDSDQFLMHWTNSFNKFVSFNALFHFKEITEINAFISNQTKNSFVSFCKKHCIGRRLKYDKVHGYLDYKSLEIFLRISYKHCM